MAQATSRCIEPFIDGDCFSVDILPCIASFDDETFVVALPVKVTIHSRDDDGRLRVPPIRMNDGLHLHATDDVFVFLAVESFVEREGNASKGKLHLSRQKRDRMMKCVWKENAVMSVHWSDEEWCKNVTLIVYDTDFFDAFLMFVTRISDVFTPFFTMALLPSPWSTEMSSSPKSARR